ncbi:MAG TPA: cupin domain-containing protein [Opitutaceae bacterium]|nr:cupin domain-containing protein [Opitutaceae bacterium]
MAETASAPTPKLGSTVFEWAKLAVKPTATGERRDIVDAPTATMKNFECHVTTLNPGEAPHEAHRHPDEELIIVKEGVLEVRINDRTQQAGPGSMLFFASNDLHGLRNAGTTRATYYVLRVLTSDTPKASGQ